MNRFVSTLAGWVVLGNALAGCGGEAALGSEEVAESADEFTLIRLPPGPLPTLTAQPPAAIADLKPEGTMHLYGAESSLGLDIHVTNIGNLGAVGTTGKVLVNGTVVPNATLHQFNALPNHPQNALYPGKRGYIHVEVPANLLSQCRSFPVQIDYAQTMQYGPSSVYANDAASVSTLCPLGWTTPVTAVTIGHPPDPLIANKSLSELVSSFQSARSDGLRCSNCHFNGGGLPYRPELVPQAGFGPHLTPSSFLDGSTWAGGQTAWSWRFLVNPNFGHTDALREAVQKWRNDGQRL